MIKLSDKGLSKAKTSWKLPLVPISQVMNAMGKFLEETKSATPGNTQMLRKWNSLTADMEGILLV